jgi:UDP-N-acetyl-D-glucosamine dehydrogenase
MNEQSVPKKIVIVGQGYVGLPLAIRSVKVGFDVVGYDTNADRIKRLAAGESYVGDITGDDITEALEAGRFLPTTRGDDCEGFDVAVITVPTPLTDGIPDLSFVKDAARILAPRVRPGCCVVLESTTYPGTTSELLAPLLEDGSGLRAGLDFHVGYSPERIDPGNPRWTLENTPKVVSGLTASCLEVVQAFYSTLVETTVAVSRPAEAELTKLLENTFRHVNIALVNEVAMSANALGIDVWEALDAASTKPFGFMRFNPGPGVGGHCLPVDPSYLSWHIEQEAGYPFRFVELANDVNNHMPHYVVNRVTAALNRDRKATNGSRILILGLAYKPNSGDAREAPGPVICGLLAALGADVRAADPYLVADDFPASATRVDATAEELAAADLVVVVTDHDAFAWDLIAKSPRVFDTRHRLAAGANIERL